MRPVDIAAPMAPPAPVLPTNGSHRLSYHNGKVTIHRRGLFAGYDATIHDSDEQMRGWTPARVKDLYDGTLTMLLRGQFPQVAISHPNRANNKGPLHDDRPSIARIVNLSYEQDGAGAPCIYGDMEMSVSDYDQYIATNRYCRCSVEIYASPMRIGAVALLGGDTPKTAIEDTHFSDRQIGRYDSPGATDFAGMQVGQGLNGFIPSTSFTKDTKMASRFNDDEKKELGEMCSAAVTAAMSAAFPTMFSAAMKAYSDDKEKEKPGDMSASSRPAPAAPAAAAPGAVPPVVDDFSALPANVQNMLRAQQTQIAQLQQDSKLAHADKLIADMSAKGVVIPQARQQEIRQWIASADKPEEIASLIFDMGHKHPLNSIVDMSGAAPAGGGPRRELTERESNILTARHGGDKKGFEAARQQVLAGTLVVGT